MMISDTYKFLDTEKLGTHTYNVSVATFNVDTGRESCPKGNVIAETRVISYSAVRESNC